MNDYQQNNYIMQYNKFYSIQLITKQAENYVKMTKFQSKWEKRGEKEKRYKYRAYLCLNIIRIFSFEKSTSF